MRIFNVYWSNVWKYEVEIESTKNKITYVPKEANIILTVYGRVVSTVNIVAVLISADQILWRTEFDSGR